MTIVDVHHFRQKNRNDAGLTFIPRTLRRTPDFAFGSRSPFAGAAVARAVVRMIVGAETSAQLTVEQHTPWGQHALLYVVFFLMGAEMFLVSPLLPEVALSLVTTIAAAAMIVTAFVLVYAIASPLLGIFSDRWPRKRSAIAGSIVFAVGNIGCAIAPGLGALIAARGITGLGAALAAPAMWACLAERTAAHQRGRAISLGASALSLSQVLGVPLAAGIAAVGGWRAPFLVVGMLMLIATISLARRLESNPIGDAPCGLTALVQAADQTI